MKKYELDPLRALRTFRDHYVRRGLDAKAEHVAIIMEQVGGLGAGACRTEGCSNACGHRVGEPHLKLLDAIFRTRETSRFRDF